MFHYDNNNKICTPAKVKLHFLKIINNIKSNKKENMIFYILIIDASTQDKMWSYDLISKTH